MAIIFGTSAGVREDALNSYFGRIGEGLNRFKEGVNNLISGKGPSGPVAPFPEKKFVDNGFTNVPGTSFPGSQIENVDDLKLRRITSQEPELTVYIKKRAFWSLRDEHNTKFMDSGEKLYLRASKILFQNKCSTIGAYEALTKLERFANDEVDFDTAIVSQLIELFEAAQAGLNIGIETLQANLNNTTEAGAVLDTFSQELNEIKPLIDSLKKVKRDNISLRPAQTTTWVVDTEQPDVAGIGDGPGVIELSSISQITTSLGLESDGNVSFTLEDPYNLTKITNDDIELALSTAFDELQALNDPANTRTGVDNLFANPPKLLEEAKTLEDRLRTIRRNRTNEFFGISGSGSSLSGQDGSEVIFEIDPSSRSGSTVTVSIGSNPQPFTNVNQFLVSAESNPFAGNNPFTLEESDLIRRVFNKLEEYVAAVRSRNQGKLTKNDNDTVKYARRNLRLFYLGKSIVQPMDGIHVYMRGRTSNDSEIIGPLNYLLKNTSFIKAFSDDGNITDALLEREMEELGINTESFPVELYRSIRTGSLLRQGGVHVFGGLVDNVTESYSDGRYTLSISGTSNLKWLKITQSNLKPALENVNGVLEDPLTPFKLETDPATGTIKPNPELLDINKERVNSGCIRYNDGVYRGERVAQDNVKQDEINLSGTNISIDQHAPGLVYTWKQGIITATANVNLKTALDSSSRRVKQLTRDAGLTITNSPFSGLDAANVISLLVTGFPHNYESFFINASESGNFTADTGTNSPDSFFNTFFNLQQSLNKAQGNFQPIKPTTLTPDVYRDLSRITSSLQNSQRRLTQLRGELARINDQIDALNIPLENFTNIPDSISQQAQSANSNLVNEGNRIASEIATLEADFYETFDSTNSGTSGLKVIGNDISFDVEVADDPSSDDLQERYKNLRLRNTFQFLRSQKDCKFNKDKNKFIVGDEYDKDLDIQAFVLNLGNNTPDLWNSQYKNPLDICRNVAKTLDFEFYCDTQGNIQFRPPRYNKIPLSLLLKLFLLSDQEGVELYPPFLRSLFETRRNINDERIRVIEDEIREKIILLGGSVGPDTDIGQKDAKIVTEDESFTLTQAISPVPLETVTVGIENTAENLIKIRNRLASGKGSQPTQQPDAQAIEDAKAEIEELNNPATPNVSTRRLAIVNELGRLISRKQQLKDISEKLYAKNQTLSPPESTPEDGNVKTDFRRGDRLNNEDDIRRLIAPFQDLIEDDLNDFLGPNSSKRYIIRDEDIISYNFTESDENVRVRYDINGQLDLIGSEPGQIGSVPALWAGATDFDLWRQYGYRPGGSIAKPYFSDPELQCAPYAQMLLTRARREAVVGTVTVRGNEYYQLGDVVYINSRDTLYYVTDIQHEFSYESKRFSTKLTLKYGHPLGEFIPGPLDVIGKTLIKNQTSFNNRFTIRNTARIDTGVSLGTIVFQPIANEERGLEETKARMLSGEIGKGNLLRLKNIFALAKTRLDENAGFKIDIRSFKLNTNISDDTLITQANAVRDWLLNPTGIYTTNTNEEGIEASDENGDFEKITANIANRPFVNENFLDISSDLNPINCDDLQEENKERFRFPKEDPWNMSRTGQLDDVVEVVLVKENNT